MKGIDRVVLELAELRAECDGVIEDVRFIRSRIRELETSLQKKLSKEIARSRPPGQMRRDRIAIAKIESRTDADRWIEKINAKLAFVDPQAGNALLRSVDVLGLPDRITDLLKRHKVLTLRDLCNYSATEMSSWKFFGWATVAAIADRLEKFDLLLKPKD